MRYGILGAVAAVVLCSSVGYAQTPDRPAVAPLESITIGATASIGWFGTVGAIRASFPLDDRRGVDLTIGHIGGNGDPAKASGLHGASMAAQLRWMRHGRAASGRSGHWLFGVMAQQGIQRTEIRFPDRTIVDLRHLVNVTPQVGYGWDRLLNNGARFGIEVSTGGNERGPSQYIQTFLAWGPRRQ